MWVTERWFTAALFTFFRVLESFRNIKPPWCKNIVTQRVAFIMEVSGGNEEDEDEESGIYCVLLKSRPLGFRVLWWCLSRCCLIWVVWKSTVFHYKKKRKKKKKVRIIKKLSVNIMTEVKFKRKKIKMLTFWIETSSHKCETKSQMYDKPF